MYNEILDKYANELLKGGKADGKPDSKYSKKEMKLGLKEEKEHTPKLQIRKEIAKDHLEEDPKYYSKQADMITPAEPYKNLPGKGKLMQAISRSGGEVRHQVRKPEKSEASIKVANIPEVLHKNPPHPLAVPGLTLATSALLAHHLSKRKPGDYDDGSSKGERFLKNLGPALMITGSTAGAFKHFSGAK